MKKSGSVENKCSAAADVTSRLSSPAKPEGNEEKWFRREKVQRLCVPHLLGSAVPSLPPPGYEENWFRRKRLRLAADVTSWTPVASRRE